MASDTVRVNIPVVFIDFAFAGDQDGRQARICNGSCSRVSNRASASSRMQSVGTHSSLAVEVEQIRGW